MKKMSKRLVSMVLVMCLLVSIPIERVDAATNNYTTWKQYDKAWNQSEAWPKSQYKNATTRKMSQAGCVVTSIAMLLRHHNVVTEQDVNRFNPWIFNEKLKAAGAFDSAANLYWARVSWVYPSFKYVGSKPYSLANIKSLYNSGYACVIKVNSYHYVALRSVSGSKVTIMDPGYNRTSLSSYKNPVTIQYYSVSGSKPTPATPVPAPSKQFAGISNYNVPGSQKEGETRNVWGTITSGTNLSYVVAGVYKTSSGGAIVTGGSARPYTKSYSIAKLDKYIRFDRLSAGNYYYRITATNSAGTKVLVNSPFNVTAKATFPSISGYNVPSKTHKAGRTFSIKGKLTSSTKITSVTAGVYTSEYGGKMLTGKTVRPNTTSYNLKNIDPYIRFDKLPRGTYGYRVEVTNGAGTMTIIRWEFRVV